MYTLYACLTLNRDLKINPTTSIVRIYDTGMTGTLAHLVPNESLRLIDLYYALMLPSGNDAACILASYYGSWLCR
jgi:D-alanyl-D-alanine carboxypeptidase